MLARGRKERGRWIVGSWWHHPCGQSTQTSLRCLPHTVSADATGALVGPVTGPSRLSCASSLKPSCPAQPLRLPQCLRCPHPPHTHRGNIPSLARGGCFWYSPSTPSPKLACVTCSRKAIYRKEDACTPHPPPLLPHPHGARRSRDAACVHHTHPTSLSPQCCKSGLRCSISPWRNGGSVSRDNLPWPAEHRSRGASCPDSG